MILEGKGTAKAVTETRISAAKAMADGPAESHFLQDDLEDESVTTG